MSWRPNINNFVEPGWVIEFKHREPSNCAVGCEHKFKCLKHRGFQSDLREYLEVLKEGDSFAEEIQPAELVEHLAVANPEGLAKFKKEMCLLLL